MSAIDIPVEMGLLTPGHPPTLLSGRLTWQPAAPIDVLLTIRHGAVTTVWLVGRDLLTAGLHGRAGDVDVRVQPYITDARSMLRIDLSSDTGAASLIVDWDTVDDFVRSTWLAVPVAQEQNVIAAALDTFDWVSGMSRAGRAAVALVDPGATGDQP